MPLVHRELQPVRVLILRLHAVGSRATLQPLVSKNLLVPTTDRALGKDGKLALELADGSSIVLPGVTPITLEREAGVWGAEFEVTREAVTALAHNPVQAVQWTVATGGQLELEWSEGRRQRLQRHMACLLQKWGPPQSASGG